MLALHAMMCLGGPALQVNEVCVGQGSGLHDMCAAPTASQPPTCSAAHISCAHPH